MLFKRSTRDIVTGKRPRAAKTDNEEVPAVMPIPGGEAAEPLSDVDYVKEQGNNRYLDPDLRKYLITIGGLILGGILFLGVFFLFLHAREQTPAGPTRPQIEENQTVITVQADEALAALAQPGDIVQAFGVDGSSIDALRYLQVYQTADNGQLLLLVDTQQAAAIVGKELSTKVVLVVHNDPVRAEELLALQKQILKAEITLTMQSTLIMTLGATKELPLQVGIEPVEATLPEIQWTSDAPNIVSVKDGMLLARDIGAAVITVRCGNAEAICTVIVEPLLERLVLDQQDTTLAVGETLQLNASPRPEGVTQIDLRWSVDDPTIATVADDGTVTAVAPGTAIITVACGEISATCSVQVGYRTELIDIKVTNLSLPAGQQYLLEPYFYPSKNLIDIPEYSSSDTSVVMVTENGVIIAIAPGNAIITLRRGDVTASCQVTVI